MVFYCSSLNKELSKSSWTEEKVGLQERDRNSGKKRGEIHQPDMRGSQTYSMGERYKK